MDALKRGIYKNIWQVIYFRLGGNSMANLLWFIAGGVFGVIAMCIFIMSDND